MTPDYEQKSWRYLWGLAILLAWVAVMYITFTIQANTKTAEDSKTDRYTACSKMADQFQDECVRSLDRYAD